MNLPFQLALVSPSGLTLTTVNSSNGIATINQPVTQGGVYVVKVINLSVGPLKLDDHYANGQSLVANCSNLQAVS